MNIIGMIHVQALPGTPNNNRNMDNILHQARVEAVCYQKHGINTVIIENMHDVPYTKNIRPEITAAMTMVGTELRQATGDHACIGVQILAGGNKEALAVAKAAGLKFIRAEGFVYGHLGDEGFFESCAGELLRYRKQIGAEDVKIYTDIKKKHSSHAMTADISLRETAEAAKFFLADGVIITGTSTGKETDPTDLDELAGLEIPVLIGSGVTARNIRHYKEADAVIVGSYFKKNGKWYNDLDEDRIEKMMEAAAKLE